ncbi:MAG: hypothetical protein CMJ98_00555 [Planctomycetes bacterium]|jgi:hypothetical protein|nr:hypothetical protein [Planctomycetota bacterium]MBV21228.1 hypothetical protein [Planctomycetaceae bacterium]HJM56011.1 hypothetical protein [Planctomycetota bacterium]
MYLAQESAPPATDDEGSSPLAIGAMVALSLLVVWAFIRWWKRPLPIERLPEVARRQRMKGL